MTEEEIKKTISFFEGLSFADVIAEKFASIPAPPGVPKAKKRRPGKPTHFTGDWAALRAAYGGTAELAEAIGISTQRLQRWALHGDMPREPVQKFVAKLARAKHLRNPFDRPEASNENSRDSVPAPSVGLRSCHDGL